MAFKDNFVWGAATASFQIEGATTEGGRKPSVWDVFCANPGKVFEGHSGDPACDHYHRYEEDVALLQQLGAKAYRLSIAWPRVMPDGIGKVNEEGLAYYDRLIDSLLAAGVQPWVTMYHWDTPMGIYNRGGWLNPDMPNYFADYTAAVVDRLSDRVSHWMTQNEPQCYVGLGMQSGIHAPGDKLAWPAILNAMHISNLAHGRSVQAIRARSKQAAKIGRADTCSVAIPATPSDIDAARKAYFAVQKEDCWNIAWWLDPVVFGTYPEDGLKNFEANMPKFDENDLKIMNEKIDFIGLNIYTGKKVHTEGDGWRFADEVTGRAMNALKWNVQPEALYWGPKFINERYNLPVVITENGMTNQDWVMLDGKVHDPQRIDYLNRHLLELRRASTDGVDIDGYFQWSLLDNFEWAEGYKERFGLVYVDYATQKRTPKDSYHWYKEVIKSNGANLG